MRSTGPSGAPRTGGGRRRTIALTIAAAVVVTPVVTGVGTAGTPPAHAATAAAVPVEQEAPDFASEVYGDPWDYSNAADQNTDTASMGSISVTGGKLAMSIRPGDWVDIVDTTAGSLPYGRDGAVKSIDTSRYKRLSFSMDEPIAGIGAIYWWTCRTKASSCLSGMTFPLVAGQHTYDIALDGQATLETKAPWTSARVVTMRLRPVVVAPGAAAVSASIDWMRLHAGTGPHDALPPGNHGSYTTEALPIPVIDSPSPADGQDLATAQRGRPWDFTNSANGSGITLRNATLRGYGSDGMTATNAGPTLNDPSVNPHVTPFSGTKYHWLSWDMTYDGPFSLADSPGGGKVARLIYYPSDAPTTPQSMNDLITWSGANAREATIDITAQDPLDENQPAPRVGWYNQTISTVTFDPNEDPSAETWHLKSFHLRADPTATNATTVKFHDAAWVAGTTAEIRVGTGAPGTPYTTIASDVPVNSGSNSATFSLGSMPAGSYRVEVIMQHPAGGGALAFSTAPIVMSKNATHDPLGSLDEVSGSDAGVTVRGWAFDPDSSAATTVRVTEGSTTLATTTTTVARPDVVRANPGAPANSGWLTKLSLSAGTHTLCATAVNVGAGNGDQQIGCRTYTVPQDTSHDPKGSFDEASVRSGTTTVALRGWSFDPDTSDVTQVAFYDQTGAAQSLGRVNTGGARADVQRAYPGAPGNSGFSTTVTLSVGTHTVCAYGINVGQGTTNPLLGCRSVSVTSVLPQGSLDEVTGGTGTVSVRGWAWDRDAGTGPLSVRVYDQTGAPRSLVTLTTGQSRTDVARAYPGAPTTTGFSGTATLGAGAHTVCVYALNVPGGDNPLLGCKDVTVR
jgi:hypothetical protein